MPTSNSQPGNPQTDVAILLARAILRLRRQAKYGRLGPGSPPRNGLEQCTGTSVSVAPTRRLGLRADGDEP